jgi:hypothetical protein
MELPQFHSRKAATILLRHARACGHPRLQGIAFQKDVDGGP